MSGLKKKFNYERYMESVKNTPFPSQIRRVRVDYKAMFAYAKEKGVRPYDLTDEEMKRFETPIQP